MPERTVYFLSDRTGITVETVGHMLLTQFEQVPFRSVNWPFIDDPTKADEVVAAINRSAQEDGLRPLVFSTLVDADMRAIIRASQGVFFDLFDAFIDRLEAELGVPSSPMQGRSHSMGAVARYDTRISALNYALNHDDGLARQGYEGADILLLGVSRSGKTPTCLYLALQYGLFAANYPLTEDDLDTHTLPAGLEPYRPKLFGLTITPQRLQQIRSERRPNRTYSALDQCRYEVRRAEQLYLRERIPYLDTSAISVEEISTTVLHRMHLERRF